MPPKRKAGSSWLDEEFQRWLESKLAKPQGAVGADIPTAPAVMETPKAVPLPPAVEPPPVPELAVNAESPPEEKEDSGASDKLESMAAGTTQMDIAQSQPYSNPLLTPGAPAVGTTTTTPANASAPVTMPTTTVPTTPTTPTAPDVKPITPLPQMTTKQISTGQTSRIPIPPVMQQNGGPAGNVKMNYASVGTYIPERKRIMDLIEAKRINGKLMRNDIANELALLKTAWDNLVSQWNAQGSQWGPSLYNDNYAIKYPAPNDGKDYLQYHQLGGAQFLTVDEPRTVQVFDTPIERSSNDSSAVSAAIDKYNKDLKIAQSTTGPAQFDQYQRVHDDAIDILNKRGDQTALNPSSTPSSNSVSPTAPSTTTQDASGMPPLHDGANPSLRVQFEEARPDDIIPSGREQLLSDVTFDAFDMVAPGFGLGASNKLFVENETRERELRQIRNFFPRNDPGVPTNVTPPPWQLQEVIPLSLVKTYFDKVDQRMKSVESAIARALETGNAVHTLPAEVKAMPSSMGLPRVASVLEPVKNNIQRWLPAFDPAGVYLNRRGLRHLHSPVNYPFEPEEDHANGGPTLRRRRSLAINLP